MESNNIFDILRAFGSAGSLGDDIREIQNIVLSYFRNKYFSRIQNTIAQEVAKQKTNPSDDIRLLYALKPYTRNFDNGLMDNVIEAAALAKTLGNIKANMPRSDSRVEAAAADKSINPDGIYDIDRECKKSLASQSADNEGDIIPILILFALLFIKF